ncbi:MAG: hypothetical protein Q4A70_01835 [Candidatus Saccharibacteria bacterium]|nr:hypothetical protein [Candidatus Saccharibacteria bacterium]
MNSERIKNIAEHITERWPQEYNTAERIGKLADVLVDLRKLEIEVTNLLCVLIDDLGVGNLPEDRPIETLGLSTKTFNRIVGNYGRNRENSPFQTIRDILNVPEHEWHKIIGAGSKATAKEIEDKIHKAGFTDFKISLDKGYKAK